MNGDWWSIHSNSHGINFADKSVSYKMTIAFSLLDILQAEWDKTSSIPYNFRKLCHNPHPSPDNLILLRLKVILFCSFLFILYPVLFSLSFHPHANKSKGYSSSMTVWIQISFCISSICTRTCALVGMCGLWISWWTWSFGVMEIMLWTSGRFWEFCRS